MQKPAIPANEKERIKILEALAILDTPIERSFERITRLAKTVFNVPIVAFSLIDSERQWFKSIQGLNVCETSRDVSFCGHAINQSEIFVVEDARQDPRFADNPLVTGDPNIRFYAGCPIVLDNDKMIGALCIIDTEPRTLRDQDILMLKDMAELITVELKLHIDTQKQQKLNSDLEKAKKQASIDNLTRVYNRGGIEDILKKKIKNSKRSGKNFSIALIDIDNFKEINDKYGHCAGDEVLRETAKRLLEGYRRSDITGRWGGEEFLIILDTQIPHDAMAAAERARLMVSTRAIEFEFDIIYTTITTGIVTFNAKEPVTLTKLIDAADKALYVGKKTGKNKVVKSGS